MNELHKKSGADKDEATIKLPSTDGLAFKRVDHKRHGDQTEPGFVFTSKKIPIPSLVDRDRIISIPIRDLVDASVRILRSEWAAALSPMQGGLPLKLLEDSVHHDQVNQMDAALEATRLARGLKALPPEKRSFIAEGKSVMYGTIEFFRHSTINNSWSFRETGLDNDLVIPGRVMIDLACRILRDPYLRGEFPLRYVDFLPCFKPEAWFARGQFDTRIDPSKSLDSYSPEVVASSIHNLTPGSEKEGEWYHSLLLTQMQEVGELIVSDSVKVSDTFAQRRLEIAAKLQTFAREIEQETGAVPLDPATRLKQIVNVQVGQMVARAKGELDIAFEERVAEFHELQASTDRQREQERQSWMNARTETKKAQEEMRVALNKEKERLDALRAQVQEHIDLLELYQQETGKQDVDVEKLRQQASFDPIAALASLHRPANPAS